MRVEPGGGCTNPEPEEGVESFVYVLGGMLTISDGGGNRELRGGGYAYLSPDAEWSVWNRGASDVAFQWIRKCYEPITGREPSDIFGQDEGDAPPEADREAPFWSVPLIPKDDVAYDMHVNIVTFTPGAVIPFAETHTMEHGLFVLQGKGVYLLNGDWIEVERGDFIWMRAFCPQACYAGGPERFRYLLYKNMNRQVQLGGRGRGAAVRLGSAVC
jgi:(S)-ureidoglycine aminohydrolase